MDAFGHQRNYIKACAAQNERRCCLQNRCCFTCSGNNSHQGEHSWAVVDQRWGSDAAVGGVGLGREGAVAVPAGAESANEQEERRGRRARSGVASLKSHRAGPDPRARFNEAVSLVCTPPYPLFHLYLPISSPPCLRITFHLPLFSPSLILSPPPPGGLSHRGRHRQRRFRLRVRRGHLGVQARRDGER